MKDWWRLVTGSCSAERRATVSWEQFSKMFYTRYVFWVECERLAQEFSDLRQGKEFVTEITMMFTERAMFCVTPADSG